MKERFIRTAFHESILKPAHACQNTFVINEFSLQNGDSRADIAVLNGKLVGYEIKTDKDTLYRLPAQITAYNQVFDKVYIVTAQKHLDGVLALVPDYWGIYIIVEKVNGTVRFKRYREAKVNRTKSTFAIAQLLWKGEAIDILTSLYNTPVKTSLTKEDLNAVLSEVYKPHSFGKIALRYLKSRQGWRTSQPQLS